MTEGEHILVVEDDPSLALWISDYLCDHGYKVSIADRGDMAVELIQCDMPDLVVLDIMLPVRNGFDVCKDVRVFYSRPILMITAGNEETDEVLGLELGADDYLGKPIKPRLLLARIKALLRRVSEKDKLKTRVFGRFRIDAHSRTVSIDGRIVALSVNEFDLLWLLASQAGTVVRRHDLISRLRGIDYDGFDRSIDLRISRIRRKLGDDPERPLKIKTIRGKGYLFASDAW